MAIMDVDMQDPPSLLPKLITAVLTQQCDIARTRRTNRAGEPPIRSWFARKFYQTINRCSQTEIADGARDYMVLSRAVANEIKGIREYNRFFKGLSGWVGFKTEWFDYQNIQRAAGETKWNFFSLVAYALDAIISFSTAPLTAVSIGGVICAFLATLLMLVIVFRALFFGDPVAGWPSTISVILFIGGIQLICLGILGQYLAKTYLETKNRPIYIIKEESEQH